MWVLYTEKQEGTADALAQWFPHFFQAASLNLVVALMIPLKGGVAWYYPQNQC